MEGLETIGDGMYRQPETGFIFGDDGVAEVQIKDYDTEQDYYNALRVGASALKKSGFFAEFINHSWGVLIKLK